MVGFGANRRSGRLPSFIVIGLMVVIGVLSFNYWTVSGKHARLLDELAEVQTQVKRTDAARSRLEKRNSELMVQVDTHRKQIDKREGDNTALEGKLQARDSLVKRCTDDKMKLQGDVSAQTTEIQRLKEQLKELKQEFMKQEEQIREVKKNSTTLERRLEYDSLQCGRQITQLKAEYEESKKRLEEEASKLRQSALGSRKAGAADGGAVAEAVGERHTVVTGGHDSPDLKAEEMGKPGSDAGMPGIEDSEVGKMEDVQFALKRPAITQNQDPPAEPPARPAAKPWAGAREKAGAGPALPPKAVVLDRPVLQVERDRAVGAAPPAALMQQQQQKPPVAVGDRPVLFDEDNKAHIQQAHIQADELGEQNRQLRAPDQVKAAGQQGAKGAGLPPNPAQMPKPLEPRRSARNQAPAEAPRHRQNDEDRDMQGDRAVDYGKRHQAIDIL